MTAGSASRFGPEEPAHPQIRTFRLEDADRVWAIAAESPEAAAWHLASYQGLPAQSAMLAFVSEEQREITGFLVAQAVHEEGEILNLAVAPGRRRRGCARALLQAALREFQAREVREVHLEVRESNAAAIAFYEAHSFVKSGLRKGYYRAPDEDAVIMSCLIA
jgi:[ribosomal protein S18]-alanine N-acetyltransferase